MLPQAAWFTTITPFATTILHFLPLICLFYNKIAKSTSGKNRVVRQKIRKKFCISLSYFGEPYHIYAFVLLLFLYMVFYLQKTNQKIFHPSENRRRRFLYSKKGTTHLAVPLILILHSVNNNHISFDQIVQLPAELAVF